MNSRFSNLSFNGNRKSHAGDGTPFDDVENEAALSDKFDQLNSKWKEAEEKLRSLVGSCDLPVIWVNAGSANALSGTWNFLGFHTEILYCKAARKPTPGNWDKITNCSANIRAEAVGFLPKLIEAVRNAVNERRKILPEKLDKAIEKLSETLGNF